MIPHRMGLIAALCFLLGCHPPTTADRTSATDWRTIQQGHQAIRDATRHHFQRAAMVLPSEQSDVGDLIWMAPLVVQQLGEQADAMAPSDRFGALSVTNSGRAEVDSDRLTVYLLSSYTPMGERARKQLVYLWFYEPAGPDMPIRWQGFRMVLNARRFGVLWEVLSADASQRVFYVSRGLERAAAERYGPPLSGRRYSVEPALDAHPEVVVARAIGDGPQPMGPFVYLDRAHRITTLACRCDPSQAVAFPQSVRYRLVPIAKEAELYGVGLPPSNLRLPSLPDDLGTILRLPAGLLTSDKRAAESDQSREEASRPAARRAR